MRRNYKTSIERIIFIELTLKSRISYGVYSLMTKIVLIVFFFGRESVTISHWVLNQLKLITRNCLQFNTPLFNQFEKIRAQCAAEGSHSYGDGWIKLKRDRKMSKGQRWKRLNSPHNSRRLIVHVAYNKWDLKRDLFGTSDQILFSIPFPTYI